MTLRINVFLSKMIKFEFFLLWLDRIIYGFYILNHRIFLKLIQLMLSLELVNLIPINE